MIRFDSWWFALFWFENDSKKRIISNQNESKTLFSESISNHANHQWKNNIFINIHSFWFVFDSLLIRNDSTIRYFDSFWFVLIRKWFVFRINTNHESKRIKTVNRSDSSTRIISNHWRINCWFANIPIRNVYTFYFFFLCQDQSNHSDSKRRIIFESVDSCWFEMIRYDSFLTKMIRNNWMIRIKTNQNLDSFHNCFFSNHFRIKTNRNDSKWFGFFILSVSLQKQHYFNK